MFVDDLAKYKNVNRFKGEIGIEIETEGLEAYVASPMAFWTMHKDDSLRGPAPYEYVLKQPLMFEKEVPEALEEFTKKTAHAKFDQDSFTTSVHVHLNMLNEKYQTIGNFLTIYALTENLIKRFAGPSRTSNLFCLPLVDAEDNFKNILRVTSAFQSRNLADLHFDPQQSKYAALNLSALYTYGSLEIRLLRGTTDTKVIQDWVGILYSILEFSRQELTPKEFINILRQKDKEVLIDIFGKYRKLLKADDEDELLAQNFWYATNTALSVHDWKVLDKPVSPKKLNHKDLDAIAMQNCGKKFDDLPEDLKYAFVNKYKFFAAGGQPNGQQGLKPAKIKKMLYGDFNEAVINPVAVKPWPPQANPAAEQPVGWAQPDPEPWNDHDDPEPANF